MNNRFLTWVFLFLMCVAILLIQHTAEAQSMTFHNLTVARHQAATRGGNDDIDWLFAAASNILQTANPGCNPADIVCQMTFNRLNAVVPFTDPGISSNGIIDTDTELNIFINSNAYTGYVRVAQQIQWCGYSSSDFWGCANKNRMGLSTIVWTKSPVPGKHMAHEFGHTVGIIAHHPDPRNIMCVGATPNINCIEEWQCTHFMMNDLSSNGGPAEFTGGSSEEIEGVVNSPYLSLSIEEVAEYRVFGKLPTEVEDYYGQEDVETLKQMLADPKQEKIHSSIAVLIALITDGSKDDVNAIIDYMSLDRGNNKDGLSLGIVVARTGNEAALQYLIDKTLNSDTESEMRGAIRGLGISGDARALAALERLVSDSDARSLLSDGLSLIDQAIDDNLLVNEIGVRGYYK